MGSLDIYILKNGETPSNNQNVVPETQDPSTSQNDTSVVQGGQNVSNSKSNLARSVIVNQMVNTTIQNAKSMLNYTVSNYGNYTGDYLSQQKLQDTMSNVGVAFNVGKDIGVGVMGAVTGNPLLVGMAVGDFVTQGVSIYQQNQSAKMNLNKINDRANFNSTRIGAVLVNGNRS